MSDGTVCPKCGWAEEAHFDREGVQYVKIPNAGEVAHSTLTKVSIKQSPFAALAGLKLKTQ